MNRKNKKKVIKDVPYNLDKLNILEPVTDNTDFNSVICLFR